MSPKIPKIHMASKYSKSHARSAKTEPCKFHSLVKSRLFLRGASGILYYRGITIAYTILFWRFLVTLKVGWAPKPFILIIKAPILCGRKQTITLLRMAALKHDPSGQVILHVKHSA